MTSILKGLGNIIGKHQEVGFLYGNGVARQEAIEKEIGRSIRAAKCENSEEVQRICSKILKNQHMTQKGHLAANLRRFAFGFSAHCAKQSPVLADRDKMLDSLADEFVKKYNEYSTKAGQAALRVFTISYFRAHLSAYGVDQVKRDESIGEFLRQFHIAVNARLNKQPVRTNDASTYVPPSVPGAEASAHSAKEKEVDPDEIMCENPAKNVVVNWSPTAQ